MGSAWLLAGWLVLAQAAQAPAAGEIESKAKRLIREIENAETQADREAATTKLQELGPGVIPFLVLPRGSEDPDLKIRLEQVRFKLQTSDARDFTAPRQITLKGKMPLSKALAELEKQGETRLLDFRARFGQAVEDPEIALELDKASFWPALDQVFDAGKLVRYPNPDRPGVAFQNAGGSTRSATGRASYPGAFRIEALDIQAARNLRREGNGAVTLNVEVAWEPRLRPFALYQDLSATQMEDDKGQPLECEKVNSTREISLIAGATSATIALNLPTPSREVRKIGRVTGKLECLMPGKVARFEFLNLAVKTPISQRQGGSVVSIERIQKSGAVWEIRLLVQFEKGLGALESYRDWALDNPCTLIDGQGKHVEHKPPALFSRAENLIGVEYKFEGLEELKDCKLTYETPVLIVKTPLVFELKGIELP